ncbi:cyclophilin-like fold protein [Veillonella sp. R32]|uniref:cyclophilin-like fold protein n=1 Tax=Veillonella sp. R32 TaxID=2021312 RepID=UPI00138A1197|nr:cyclophilin-like fold protein [Veillonella sp. R32]KAF1683246.1 hypothetical protein VER_02470 [Veillonella sp. R32]
MNRIHQICRALLIGYIFVLLGTLAGCTQAQEGIDEATKTAEMSNVSNEQGRESLTNSENQATEYIKLHIQGQTVTFRLANTAAAKQFAEQLPQTLTLEDVNDNEKYIVLNSSLPTDSKVAGTIKAGQLKLWGRQGLVLFYKNFESSYAYTDLGEAVNPIDWEELLGDGNVTITFSK